MTPNETKRTVDDLIAAANAIAKVKLDAEASQRDKLKRATLARIAAATKVPR